LAATELDLTQGAISRLIRSLEIRLGIQLFERVKQRVVLTEPGTSYWREVQSILKNVDEATARVRAAQDGTSVLNIAVLTTFAVRWLVPALPEFLASNPHVSVNLAARVSPQDLALGSYDAAIHYGAPVWAGAFVHHLMDESVLPICSPAYGREQNIREPKDLTRTNLLQQLTRPAAWASWFSEMGIIHPHAFSGHRFDHFGMSIQAALHDLGVALVPRFLVEGELARGELVALFDHALKNQQSYFLVVPEARELFVQPFTEWIVAKATRT